MLSLVIVNYNQGRYLGKAIASILKQTQKDWELLIWDDGSTDNSVAIARKYQQQDKRIKVIAAIHQGVAKARKQAIEATTGDYIGWIDGDDWIANTALEETAKVLDSNAEVGMVYTDYYDVNRQGKILRKGKRCNIPYSPQRLLVDFMTFHFRLFRREVYQQTGGINTNLKYAQDYDLCLRLSEITEIARVTKPLYYYRRHRQSISYSKRQEQIQSSEQAINEALQRRGLSDSCVLKVEGDRFYLRKKEKTTTFSESPQFPSPQVPPSPRPSISLSQLFKTAITVIIPFTAAIALQPASAQQIIPNNDGTMTVITKDGSTFNIDGGTLSGDGKNLFHSFQEFGLDAGQIANFLSNPNIQNILGRINGGNPSIINGLIQVSGGNSNLFLMNPSGIIFGNNASLNVPGDFTATTATGIGFGNGWFNAVGVNDYLNLVGNPNSFNFANSESGVIINAGDLTAEGDSNISLTGGTVINTGTIATEGGNITVAAVPGTNRVRISQEGQILSLEVAIPQNDNGEALPIKVVDLPNLLRGLPVGVETGLEVAANDDVTVANSNTAIPNTPGTNIVSGTVDVSDLQSGGIGGEAQILGDKVGLIGANIDASGDGGAGKVLAGGEFQGKGTLPTAEVTLVDTNSEIKADAVQTGDGGELIVWADKTTAFYGNISATGGSNSGNGGFVEVSGQQNLIFNGTVDTFAPNGNLGDLLLDPNNITVAATGDTPAEVNALPDNVDGTVSASSINNATSNVTLQANNDITFSEPVNITNPGVGLTAEANNNINVNSDITTTAGDITLTGDADNTNGGAVNISNATLNSAGGNITLSGTGSSNISSDSNGVRLNPNAVITSGDGNILITGTGSSTATGERNRGIDIENDVRIEATGTGTITLDGTGGNGTDGNSGIFINNTDTEIKSVDGAISLTGRGSTTATAQNNRGINIQGGARIESTGTGNITLDGTGGAGTNGNIGIFLNATATEIKSADGTISLTGRGSTTATAQNNRGINIQGGARIESTGAGNITLDGTGGSGINNNHGIFLNGAATEIKSVDGTISLTGRGSDLTTIGSNNRGIGIQGGATVESTGAGNITLDGTRGAGADENRSVFITGTNTLVKTTSGDIDITGRSNTTDTIDRLNRGIDIQNGAIVESTSSGNITLDGTGGSGVDGNTGVYIGNNSEVRSPDGEIALTGTSTANSNAIIVDRGSISTSNDLTLTGDSIELINTPSLTGDNVTLQPQTVELDIAIAPTSSTDSVLDIAQTELNSINATSLTIGRSDGTGTLTVNSDGVFFTDPVTLQAGNIQVDGFVEGREDASINLTANNGAIVVNEAITTNSNDVTVDAGTNVDIEGDITTNGGTITINTGSTIDSSTVDLNSSSEDASGGDINVTATGDINLGGVNSRSNSDSPEDKAGDVTVTSTNGAISAPPVTSLQTLFDNNKIIGILATGNAGNGGDVNLSAAGDIKLLGVVNGSLTGNGGTIDITSQTGAIDGTVPIPNPENPTETINFGLLLSGTGGQTGGDITLQAEGDITTGFIYSGSFVTGSGGRISITSNSGSIDTAFGANSIPGIEDIVDIPPEFATVLDNVLTGVNSGSGNNAGDITITANNGNITTSDITATSNTAIGGEVTITSSGTINAQSINTSGTSSKGDVTLSAPEGIATTYIDGGNINVDSNGVDNNRDGLFVATGTIPDDSNISIRGTDNVIIEHGGGNTETAFEVGNSTTTNGTAENIVSTTETVADDTFTETFISDGRTIQIITTDAPPPPIVAAEDGTGSLVIPQGDGITFNLEGGTVSGDEQNLFHSYTRFDLPESNQTANFIVDNSIENILARVTSGDASDIRGRIQVTTEGNPNLFLLNPAGIIFGATAQLDVPGAFTASTGNGVRFGDNWFSASGAFNASVLNGTPEAIALTSNNPGSIINNANLTNTEGALNFIGGTVVNSGDVNSNGFAAVALNEGESVVNLSDFTISSTADAPSLPNEFTGNIEDINSLISLIDEEILVPDGDDTTLLIQNPINSNGQDINLVGNNDLTDESNSNAVDAIAIDAAIDSGGGNITLNGSTTSSNGDAIDIEGTINSGGGDIAFNGSATNADSAIDIEETINSEGGTITLNGTSTNGDSGIDIDETINSGGGDITLEGTSDITSGIEISDGIINANGGNINITGRSVADDGVFIRGQVTTSNDGAINITGTSTESIGIETQGTPEIEGSGIIPTTISTVNGSIDLTGTSTNDLGIGTQNTNITSNNTTVNTGAIAITGSSETQTVIQLETTNISTAINADSPDTKITLTADTMDLEADLEGVENSFTSNELVLQPLTPSRNINLEIEIDPNNPRADALNFANGKIEELSKNVNSITIGREDGNGTITVTDDFDDGLNVESNLTLRTPEPNGAIVINDSITTDGGKITINTGSTIDSSTVDLDSSSEDASGGDINVTATGDINFGGVNSRSNSDSPEDKAGDVTVTSTNGAISAPPVTSLQTLFDNDKIIGILATGNAGNGGDVTFTAAGDIKLLGVVNGSLTGNGGTIDITSQTGAIDGTVPIPNPENPTETINFGLLLSGTGGQTGGDITLQAEGDITTGFIYSGSFRTGDGGRISITSNSGSIDTAFGANSIPGIENIVDIPPEFATVLDNVLTGVNSASGNNAGDITITANNGNITTSDINATSNTATGGEVTITASGTTNAQSINTSGTSSTGDITLSAPEGIATTYIDGGNINIDSNGAEDDTNGLFIATDTIPETNTSIRGTNVIIEHGGGSTTPFVVGGATTNGTVGNIVSTSESVGDATFPESFRSEGRTIQILTTDTPVPIVAAEDDTGSVVTPQGDGVTFDLTGGTLSGDGQNLFHSYTRFDLPESNQTANFIVNNSIENILARVTSGDASDIRGRIQVTGGDPNLFLLNPAGIIFGATAQLDVPGAFTASTGNGVGFRDNWFSASGAFNASVLNGTPEAIALTSNNPGSIINNANLVDSETNNVGALNFIGGTVVNSGDVSSNDFAAVALNEGASIVNLSNFTISSTEGVTNLPNTFEPDILAVTDLIDLISEDSINVPNGDDTGLEIQNPINSNGQDINLIGNSNDAQGVRIETNVNANGGNINITGTSDAEDGVFIRGQITTTNEGNINITGTSTESIGIETQGTPELEGSGIIPTTITTVNGSIDLTGTSTNELGIGTQNTNITSNNTTVNTGAIAITGSSETQTVIQLETTNISTAINADSPDTKITLTADTMDLEADVEGNELVLQPLTPSRNINLEIDPNNPRADALNFANGKIEELSKNVNSITIGRENGTGTITVTNDVGDGLNVESNLTLRTPQPNGAIVINDTIETSETLEGGETPNVNKDITLNAGTNVDINRDITSNGGKITITSGDTIDTTSGLIISGSTLGDGGDINLTAQNNINTGSIVSSSGGGNGGKITLQSDRGAIDTTAASRFPLGDNQEIPVENGVIASASANGDGGAIELNAAGDINTGTIVSSSLGGDGNGGDITLTSQNGTIDTTKTTAIPVSATNQISGLDATTSSVGADTATGGEITLTTSGNITPQNITTNNNTINLNGVVNLAQDSTITSNGTGDINFNNTVDGASNLTLNSGSGNIDFEGAIGSAETPVGNIEANSTGTTSFDSTVNATSIVTDREGTTELNGAVTTTGDQTYRDAIELGSDTILQGANVRANSTINGGEQSLTVNATEDAEFNDAVTVSSLTTDTAGTTELNANVTTTGDQTYTANEVDIATGVDIRGNTVTLKPKNSETDIVIAPNTQSDNTFDLTQAELEAIEADSIAIGDRNNRGTITVANPVTIEDPTTLTTSSIIQVNGDITAIEDASVTLDSSETNLNSDITTQGNPININSPVNLESNVELSTTQNNNSDGANITIEGDINGNNNLTLDAGSGNINLQGNLGDETPLRTLNATGTISTSGGDLDVTANSISTENITTEGGNVNLRSTEGAISTGNIDSSGEFGGDITLDSANTIATEAINSEGTSGAGGDVTLNSGDNFNIRVGTIRADGTDGDGGKIQINADSDNPGLFVANDSFDLDGERTSIFTNNSTDEAIIIKHGGRGVVPFEVANPEFAGRDNVNGERVNGTVGAIVAEDSQINDGSFPFTERRGNIGIISIDDEEQQEAINRVLNRPEDKTDEVLNSNSNQSFTESPLMIASIPQARETLLNIAKQAAQKPALVYVNFASSQIPTAEQNSEEYFRRAENCLTEEYKKALNLQGTETAPVICLAAQPTDELEILVITPEGEPIYLKSDVTREEVEEQAEELYLEVSDNEIGWREPSQQLYQWLIADIEEELATREIDNLLFVLPPKLRSLPIAALYDGRNREFLVQKGYNVGLAPSINLMNTIYTKDIQDAEVLALGASDFTEEQQQVPLNAVEVELNEIVELRGGNDPILNEQFTLPNLQSTLDKNSLLIVHLATHANFDTDNIENIYIQLYDRKLTLDQLKSLDIKVGNIERELLVLSACRSAFGNLDAELGFAGLAVKLGFKTAIGSLWYVEDITNPGLMAEFYHQLKTTAFKAEALRLAQVAMIEGKMKIDLENGQIITSWGEIIELPKEDLATLREQGIDRINLSHPYYWAPFTVIGSPW